MLTDEQVNELRRLEKAATPGEWLPCAGSGNCECTGLHSDAADGVICDFLPNYELNRDGKKVIVHDMRFVAALRNAAPALLSAHADAVRLRHTLETIAKQRTSTEIEAQDGFDAVADADFEGAYNIIVGEARASINHKREHDE